MFSRMRTRTGEGTRAPNHLPIAILAFAVLALLLGFLGPSGRAHAAAPVTATTTTITNGVPLLSASVVGQKYVVKFKVAPVSGTGTPTGNVTISGDGAGCTAPVASLQCEITPTTAAPKLLKASYEGDASFGA